MFFCAQNYDIIVVYIVYKISKILRWRWLLIKNTANFITSLRIVFAFVIVFAEPSSKAFWICYFCGGFTDLMDGFIARKLNQQSSAGAKLDSIADTAFAMAIFIVAINNLSLPVWIWLCTALIALLRMVGYIIGLHKYRTFSSLHTYANKATGALIFASPLLYAIWGMTIVGIILCILAFASSLEELIITTKSEKLNRDCKTILIQ